MFNQLLKQHTDDYNMKKAKAFKYYRIAKATKDPKAFKTLQAKAEKWIQKAELCLDAITKLKTDKKAVEDKIQELNQLKTQ